MGSEVPRRLAVLVNPAAGGGRAGRLIGALEAALNARGLSFRLERTRDMAHGVELALRAVEAGETPVVMSGDGLIGRIGGALAGSPAALGIVPGGRGNDLARVLGIPRDIEAAAAVLASGTERAIDVGEANGQRFLCIASAGCDAEANRIANQTRWLHGAPVYLYAALRALAGWRPAHFTVLADGERHELTGYAVSAANSKAYGGGMYLAPKAKLDDGKFDLVMTGEISKLRFLRSLPKLFRGEHLTNDAVKVVRASDVEIAADRPLAVYADGEHLTDLPASLRVLPGALRVIVP